MTIAYIALGSNLGDRASYLDRALTALRQCEGVEVTRVSPVYETRPVGGPPGQGAYLNAVAELQTERSAHDLLDVFLAIEQSLGRVRTESDAPRTIDLDLLLYGDLVHTDERLTVPHPRLHERLFVLQPLAQLAPGLIHPALKRSIADLLAGLQGLRLYSPPTPTLPHKGGEGERKPAAPPETITAPVYSACRRPRSAHVRSSAALRSEMAQ